jgi:hypothetical protein
VHPLITYIKPLISAIKEDRREIYRKSVQEHKERVNIGFKER